MKTTTKFFSFIAALFLTLSVSSQTCTAGFTYTNNANGNVAFTSTSAPASSITIYTWGFGNGITYSIGGVPTMSMTYTANAVYNVTLTACNGTNCCTSVQSVSVANSNTCGLVANFTSTVVGNGAANFGNTSSGTTSLTNYFWNFGNGNTSTLTSPSTTYTSNGVYTVTLRDSISPGCFSVFSHTIGVTSVTTCVLNASFTAITGSVSGMATFSNTTTGTNSTTVYFWNFGNGNTSTLTSPANTYTANGVYTVTLTAVNTPSSCFSVFTKTVGITNISPPSCALVLTSTAATSGCNGAVNVASITGSGMCGFVTYTVFPGGGNIGVSSLCAGVYTVLASGTGSGACCTTASGTISVASNTCNLSANFSISQGSNGAVSFSNTSGGTNSISTHYYWVFGNGNTSTLVSPSTTYSANGIYTVMLIDSIPPSCTSVISKTLVITSISCSMHANFSATQGSNGLVNFQNTSTAIVGLNTYTAFGTATYTWNFGDGTNSYTAVPAHTYGANGIYTITMVASINSITCSNIPVTKTISVCSYGPSFSYTVGSGGSVNFASTSVGMNQNTSYSWSGYPYIQSNTTTASHVYFNGTYTVVLYIYDGNCGLFSQPSVFTITNNPCPATSVFTHTLGNNGTVQFSTSATNTNVSFNWNFGDGVTSTAANPSHQYLSAGNYTVQLNTMYLQNGDTCSDYNAVSINITGISCVANANFSIQPTNTLHYYNLIPAYPWNVSNVLWNWGDASTSNQMYASHTYSAAGNYDICLTVTASCGSTATACSGQYLAKGIDADMVYVNVVAPDAVNGIIERADANSSFHIFPNPNAGILNVLFNQITSVGKVEVYDLVGKKVFETMVTPTAEEKFQLNLSQLENGIYFLLLDSGGRRVTEKFIIAK